MICGVTGAVTVEYELEKVMFEHLPLVSPWLRCADNAFVEIVIVFLPLWQRVTFSLFPDVSVLWNASSAEILSSSKAFSSLSWVISSSKTVTLSKIYWICSKICSKKDSFCSQPQ